MAKEAANKKTKRPTAQKRDLQNEKRRLRNKAYKSQARTAIRSLRESVSKQDGSLTQTKLNEAYSILDKCVKKGVLKPNTANRTKSRLAAYLAAKV